MILIIIIVAALLCFIFVEFRLMLLHPFRLVKYIFVDIYRYFHDRAWDICPTGQLNCYFAHFGGGKTLSVVHYVRYLYKRYHNKTIYDRRRHKWCVQKIHIISNVELIGVPFEPFGSLGQIVGYAKHNKDIDADMDTRTCLVVLLDEASSEMNSRDFRDNIDANFLNALVTSRHFNMNFLYTSQKFNLVDKLLRSVTQRCIWCDKRWRFMVQHFYDADELEYATNPELVKPFRRKGFFVSDTDYNTYDTLATVDRLDKSTQKGTMMTPAEILALRGESAADNDQVTRPSRKLKRIRK